MDSTVIFDPAARPALGRRVTRTDLRDFAATIETRVAKRHVFTCLITGNAELQRLNRVFLRKDYPTDVLSFPIANWPPGALEAIGEIAISADRALAQAREYGHSLADELKILMLHGVLHLTGLDHESDQGEMARAEIRWRKVLQLPNGLIERAKQ